MPPASSFLVIIIPRSLSVEGCPDDIETVHEPSVDFLAQLVNVVEAAYSNARSAELEEK